MHKVFRDIAVNAWSELRDNQLKTYLQGTITAKRVNDKYLLITEHSNGRWRSTVYPRPEHMGTFALARLNLRDHGPAFRYPGALGVARINYSMDYHPLKPLELALVQSFYKIRSRKSANNADIDKKLAREHAGWRKAALHEALKFVALQGRSLFVANPLLKQLIYDPTQEATVHTGGENRLKKILSSVAREIGGTIVERPGGLVVTPPQRLRVNGMFNRLVHHARQTGADSLYFSNEGRSKEELQILRKDLDALEKRKEVKIVTERKGITLQLSQEAFGRSASR